MSGGGMEIAITAMRWAKGRNMGWSSIGSGPFNANGMSAHSNVRNALRKNTVKSAALAASRCNPSVEP